MDKEFLKKYNLEEAVKRFNQINEYTFITSPIIPPVISEDGEDDNDGEMQPPQQGQMDGGEMPPQGGGGQQPDMQQDAPQPQDDGMGGGMGNDAPMPPQNGQEDPSMGGNPDDMMGGAPDMGMNPDEMGDPNMGPEQEGDEVIDVDDLTQSQEVEEIKIDGVDTKLTRMLSLLNKFSEALNASDRKIEDLKKEFEKRNPSQEEKLNLRSQASYPYSETPKDYWQNKTETNPHYNVMYDNDVSTADEQKKFEITKDDVKNFNIRDIERSFDTKNYKLDDFLRF